MFLYFQFRIFEAQVQDYAFKLENALENNVIMKQDLEEATSENERLKFESEVS